MLRIKDLLFDTKDATLEALLNNGELLWSVNVETFEREIDGEFWQPRAYVDLYPAVGRSMNEFTQHDWHIENAREYGGDFIAPWQPNCCLYVFEHDFLENSRLKFSSSLNSLSLSWSGRCSVHWGKEYDINLDFLAETEVEFLGFHIPVETEGEARELMEPLFDLKGLVFYQEPGQAGSYLVPGPGMWPTV